MPQEPISLQDRRQLLAALEAANTIAEAVGCNLTAASLFRPIREQEREIARMEAGVA